MNDRNGISCPRYRAIRDLLVNSTEYKTLTDTVVNNLNPIINNITGANLQTYNEGLEYC